MLLINKTGMLMVAGNALGFFTGSGNVIPFSLDLSDFCRFSQVVTNFTFTSETYVVLLLFKFLPSNAAKKLLVKKVENTK